MRRISITGHVPAILKPRPQPNTAGQTSSATPPSAGTPPGPRSDSQGREIRLGFFKIKVHPREGAPSAGPGAGYGASQNVANLRAKVPTHNMSAEAMASLEARLQTLQQDKLNSQAKPQQTSTNPGASLEERLQALQQHDQQPPSNPVNPQQTSTNAEASLEERLQALQQHDQQPPSNPVNPQQTSTNAEASLEERLRALQQHDQQPPSNPVNPRQTSTNAEASLEERLQALQQHDQQPPSNPVNPRQASTGAEASLDRPMQALQQPAIVKKVRFADEQQLLNQGNPQQVRAPLGDRLQGLPQPQNETAESLKGPRRPAVEPSEAGPALDAEDEGGDEIVWQPAIVNVKQAKVRQQDEQQLSSPINPQQASTDTTLSSLDNRQQTLYESLRQQPPNVLTMETLDDPLRESLRALWAGESAASGEPRQAKVKPKDKQQLSSQVNPQQASTDTTLSSLDNRQQALYESLREHPPKVLTEETLDDRLREDLRALWEPRPGESSGRVE